MRSMKRAGALTLAALILAFSLTACGKDGGSSGSGASSSAAGSTSSSEPITVDLDAVTDVFLTTAGIPGDTVVAQVGDVDITAAELLYWVGVQRRQHAQLLQHLFRHHRAAPGIRRTPPASP